MTFLAPLAGIRTRLFEALVAFLVQPIKHDRPLTAADPDKFAEVLRRGDVLLSEGNTRAAALVKRLTRSTWSHVSMYVGPLEDRQDPLCVVEADIAAGVRSIRLSELNALHVRVLRPTGLNDVDRDRLAEWVIDRVGSEYDFAHAWLLGRKLLRLPIRPRPSASAGTRTHTAARFICCSLLAHAFAQVGTPIWPAQEGSSPAAAVDHASVTPGDFESASAFEVVCPTIGVG
jgi:Permuted papain-like amidase enzyme, YaeF/YiiX, C92 family